MNTRTKPAKGISVLAHPMAFVIMAAALVLAGVILSFSEHASPAGIRRSLILGLELWVPYVIYVKWICRRNKGFYAAICAKGWLRMTLAEQMRHSLMLVFPPFFALGIAFPMLTEGHGRTPPGPMLAVFGILSILIYPEQKAIWLAAKARLAESENEE